MIFVIKEHAFKTTGIGSGKTEFHLSQVFVWWLISADFHLLFGFYFFNNAGFSIISSDGISTNPK